MVNKYTYTNLNDEKCSHVFVDGVYSHFEVDGIKIKTGVWHDIDSDKEEDFQERLSELGFVKE